MRYLDNWLTSYMYYVDNSEPPLMYHFWTGIFTIAAALQRKCWLNWGSQGDMFPGFYIALVGPPGGRKGTAMKIGKKLLHNVGISLGADCITRASLAQELEARKTKSMLPNGEELEHCSLSFLAEELAVLLGDRDMDMIVTLTDLFDARPTGVPWEYSTKNKGKNKIFNAYLNIIGGITPSLLHRHMSPDAIGAGLASRMIFVVERGKRKLVSLTYLTEEELELERMLAHDLEQISNLSGPFRLHESTVLDYDLWYRNPKSSQAIDNEMFLGYNERRSVHVRKLAMVMAAAKKHNPMIIERADFNRALSILESTEQHMPSAFQGIGRATHAPVMSELIELIRQYKIMSINNLMGRFKMDLKKNELLEIIDTLEMGGAITRKRDTKGVEYIHYKEKEDEPTDPNN